MSRPTYVYDVRTQFEEPVFVAYDDSHVDLFLQALYGEERPSFVMVSKVRMHKTKQNERYLDLPEGKRR